MALGVPCRCRQSGMTAQEELPTSKADQHVKMGGFVEVEGRRNVKRVWFTDEDDALREEEGHASTPD